MVDKEVRLNMNTHRSNSVDTFAQIKVLNLKNKY